MISAVRCHFFSAPKYPSNRKCHFVLLVVLFYRFFHPAALRRFYVERAKSDDLILNNFNPVKKCL